MPVFSQSPATRNFMRRFPDFVEYLDNDDPRADKNPRYRTMFSPVEYDMAGTLIDYYGPQVTIIEKKQIDGGFICVYELF